MSRLTKDNERRAEKPRRSKSLNETTVIRWRLATALPRPFLQSTTRRAPETEN
jgi:hypothetical protein